MTSPLFRAVRQLVPLSVFVDCCMIVSFEFKRRVSIAVPTTRWRHAGQPWTMSRLSVTGYRIRDMRAMFLHNWRRKSTEAFHYVRFWAQNGHGSGQLAGSTSSQQRTSG